jgi:hypothetical protein
MRRKSFNSLLLADLNSTPNQRDLNTRLRQIDSRLKDVRHPNFILGPTAKIIIEVND